MLCRKCQRDLATGALFCSFCGAPAVPPEAPKDAYIGQTIAGKYFIHQLLGRGGMGEVYKATHLTLDRPVVLKLLRKSLLDDPTLVQRFHREARAASRLNHPNSVNIIDFGQTEDGALFIAMEFLAGRSLARVIAEEQPIPESRVVHVGAQVLAALAEAHALGIIHRDLKPENVMLEARREDPDFVKVLDFGIAQLSEPGEGTVPRLTQAGMVCGTPGYMSPEQIRGEELDPRSDLYAVGVILYEMLAGKLPFEAATPMALVTKSLVEAPLSMAQRRPGAPPVTPELEEIVMRAMARERDGRFASADEMRAALLGLEVPRGATAARHTPAPRSTVVLGAAPALPPTPPSAVPRTAVLERMAAPAEASPAVRRTPAPPVPAGSQEHASAAPPSSTPAATPAGARAAARPTPSSRAADRRTPLPQAPDDAPDDETAEEVVRPRRHRATPRPSRAGVDARPPPSRRGLLIAGGAGGAAVVAAVLVLLLREKTPGPTPPPPPPVRDLSPPVRTTPAPPTPSATASPPPPTPEQTQARADAASTSGAGGETAQVPVSPAPTRTPPPAPNSEQGTAPAPPPAEPRKAIRVVKAELNSIATPPASTGDGVLSIQAVPWADIAVDGRALGESPRELRVAEGSYRVRARHPQFGVREETIRVRAGERKHWTATFPQ
jgi:serine/threonine-protein kinase